MDKYEVKQRINLSEREIAQADAFIMKETTTGEFINTFNYLGYHSKGRFQDDSIVVVDRGSGEIRGVMVAATDGEEGVTSYPGTTFAGPIVNRMARIEEAEAVLNHILDYYESKYNIVKIKKIPEYYTRQPFQLMDYIFLHRGYSYGMTALANIIKIGQLFSTEDIFEIFCSKRRNQVRRVVKEKNFIFMESDVVREEVWINMNKNLHIKFASKTTHTLEEIRELKRRCPNNIKMCYVDTIQGEYGAFAVIFLFKNVFHTQYLDVNYEYAKQYPNLLLILELIKLARKMGYEYFSFGASTERNGEILNRGLYSYKSEYGGGDILLPVYTKIMRDL